MRYLVKLAVAGTVACSTGIYNGIDKCSGPPISPGPGEIPHPPLSGRLLPHSLILLGGRLSSHGLPLKLIKA